MLHVRIIRSSFALILLLHGGAVYAQKGEPNTGTVVWKKRVERQVRMFDTTSDTKKQSATLLHMLVDAIKAGTLPAYSNWDNHFSTRLTPDEIKDLCTSKSDTVEVEDPVSEKIFKQVRVTEFMGYEVPILFRTLEEWTFNPLTLNTEIQITGIAPVWEIYGDDGIFRGYQASFWVKYKDAQKIVNRHATLHPNKSLMQLVWNDYFTEQKKKASDRNTGSITSQEALSLIDLSISDDTAQYHLKDVSELHVFGDILSQAAEAGNIKAYRQYVQGGFSGPMDKAGIKEHRYDTLEVQDPVDGKIVKVPRTVDYNLLSSTRQFSFVEKWSLDPANGKTIIKPVALAALSRLASWENVQAHRVLLWLRFDEPGEVLVKDMQYNTGHTFAEAAWNNYFKSHTKPILQY